jgi:hypothetical protein
MKTKEQKALNLASILDEWTTQLDMGRKPDPKSLTRKASAELRRLHREIERIKAAQPAQEPVEIYQYQLASGAWIDQEKTSHDYNVRLGQATVRIVYATPPAAQPAIIQNYLEKDNSQLAQTLVGKWTGKEIEWTENPYKFKQGQNVYTTPPAAPVQKHVAQQILAAFPLLDDEGLDKEEHDCEWALQQDRKRLHAMLSTPPAAQPAPDCKETGVCVQTGLACFGQAAQPEQVDCPRCGHVCSQRTWVGLTDEQRRVCVQSPFTEENYRAIEVKLKENNS